MASENDECLVKEGVITSQDGAFTLHVLSMIKDSHQQHGLRHDDFQRYRQYCGRRLRRIRRSLNFLQGNKHHVKPRIVEEEHITEVRYLYIPLVEAERAWAYAMQLKAESNTEHRKEFHMCNRLKKAVSHAKAFAVLCDSDKIDACTKLEAQAYAAWMEATLAFETKNWKPAMELFTKAKLIYAKLSGAFVDEKKEIYESRVAEMNPNIRYCAYSIGDETAIEDLRQMRMKAAHSDPITSKLDELIEKTREKQASMLCEVEWRGRTMPVKNEKVRMFLLSIQDLKQQLDAIKDINGRLSIYESLTKELIEAQQSLRDELKEDPVFKLILKGQQHNLERVPNSVYLHTYLMYLKHTKAVERNLLMITSLQQAAAEKHGSEHYKPTKPQDLARLYDIIVLNLTEIVSLPGLEDDTKLMKEIDAQAMGFKAFRCFYIAKSCAVIKKWKESMALYERVNAYCKEALKSLKAVNQVHIGDKMELIQSLHDLTKEVDGIKYSVHASSILDVENLMDNIVTLSVKNTKPLVERLDQYVADTTLVSKQPMLSHFPPDFEPVPCKPLFFDLALNHINFPSVSEKLEGKKQVGGLTGMVKGWFWSSKK